MYGLLARLWLREADEALLTELCSPPLSDFFVQAGGSLPEKDNPHAVEELAVDYCQLFVGPAKHLPPFQSVWQTGQFQSLATAAMKQWIETTGYKSGHAANPTMPDHLGVQLDVMAHILSRHGIAHKKADSDIASHERTQTFFRTHLTWPAPLLKIAIARAESPFYRSLIQMTRDFLECEQP